MTVWPVVFVRNDRRDEYTRQMARHEAIHAEQQKELLLIGFYILYLFYWVKYGYRNIPFEKEAYECDQYSMYLEVRRPFAWVKHIRKRN